MVDWPKHDYGAWRKEQDELRQRVVVDDVVPDPVGIVAGFDAAYDGRTGYGALVFVDADTGAIVERVAAQVPVDVPYVPGFLAYRELPLLAAAWDAAMGRGMSPPDLLFVDGAGRIHPRGVGLAGHAGLRYDLPTIGITKNLMLGRPDRPLDILAVGDAARIEHESALIGYALRTTTRATKPVFVSPGHRITADTALAWTLRFVRSGHKLPVPTHEAHRTAGDAKRARF